MKPATFIVLFFAIISLAGQLGVAKASKTMRVSSQFMELFEQRNITKEHSRDVQELTENIASFLRSVNSRRTTEKDDLILKAVKAFDTRDTSPEDLKCLQDIKTWTMDKTSGQLYAWQMQDSWASREGGMLEGNVRWTGHYWECVNAIGDEFKGKFCTTYYGFRYVPTPFAVPYDITYDSCFPDSCSAEIIQELTANATKGHILSPVLETTCSTEDKYFGGYQITAIVLCSILLLLACIGTGYDISLRIKKQTSKNWKMCFSVLKNGEKILDTRQSPDNIAAINGIRTISTLWVILGHTLAIVGYMFDNVLVIGKEARQRFEYLVILNGTYSVDTFFVIAGILTSYLTLKTLKKTKGKLNVPMMYLHRWLRLTPAYAFVLIFLLGLFKFLGAGPRWTEISELSIENCTANWWTNILYINNLYPIPNYCFGHSWYLACDMQFFILAPMFIYLLYKIPLLGVIKTLVFMFASIGITWYVSEESDQQPIAVSNAWLYSILSRLFVIDANAEISFEQKFKTDIYFTPWCRISVYLLGLLAGFILHKTQRKMKIPKIGVFLGWLISVGTGISLVYGLYGSTSVPESLNVHVAAFYNAVSRPLWGASVAWVIIACTCGYGGPVTTFLNWSFWLPLSRLGYSTYLVHLYVIYWQAATSEKFLHFSSIWLAYTFSGHVIISFIIGFIVALFVEWPCQEIVRHLLPTRRSPKPSNNQQNDQDKENISLEKPPSYRSEDEAFDNEMKPNVNENVYDKIDEKTKGNDNFGFDMSEKSTKI